MAVVAFSRWATRYGMTREEVARRLGVTNGTVGMWERGWREDRLSFTPRGRPALRADLRQRERVMTLLRRRGLRVGLPTLQAIFTDIPKRELEDLLRRYRRVHLRGRTELVHTLTWECPGTVWAMDFTEPPMPVDGIYPYILAVRDLASGNQLTALSCRTKEAKVVAGALLALFIEHGAPLVIKCDNDSSFTSAEVAEVLRQWGVLLLLSPPATPEYNGACEAGIGSLKTRAHHESARNNRPGEWTCDDVEGARLQANQTARPRGHLEPTPVDLWKRREAVSPAERHLFGETVRRMEKQARKDLVLPPEGTLGPRDAAQVRRIGITRALVEHGYLFFRRRRIPSSIKSRLLTKIT